ncbi:MAG: glycosyltransferase [Solirubrobacteraceae bacterium]
MTVAPPREHGLRALYVCYLGLDDPLVHTQVVAYLAGLSARGHVIHLLTFETGRLSRERRRCLRTQLLSHGVRWHGLRYHKRPSLPATLYDVVRGALMSTYLMRRHRLEALHARSHIPAAMALIASRLASFRLLFDIRGLMAEEYVDAGNWRTGSLPFRLTKAVERSALERADAVVVLTERARHLLFADAERGVAVIPCCVDVAQVQREAARQSLRNRLGLSDRPVLIYVGKFTGWYLQREMVDFFARARQVMHDLHFLILTQSDPSIVLAEFERFKIPPSAHTITEALHQEMGGYLSVADAAIAFIRPCHSKLCSSPTKIGEYLASGLPIVTGPGIGDVDRLLEEFDAGVVLESFEPESLDEGVQRLRARIAEHGHADRCRRAAAERLSLAEVGVPRYDAVYRNLATMAHPSGNRRC